MRVTPLLFLSALAPAVRAQFRFTSPGLSNPLNFSEPIVFEWTSGGTEYRSHWLRIIFVSNDGAATYRIGANRDLIDITKTNTWTWDDPWADVLEGNSVRPNNWFEASLSSEPNATNTLSRGRILQTANFKIVANGISAGAGPTTPSLGLALAAGAMAIMFAVGQ